MANKKRKPRKSSNPKQRKIDAPSTSRRSHALSDDSDDETSAHAAPNDEPSDDEPSDNESPSRRSDASDPAVPGPSNVTPGTAPRRRRRRNNVLNEIRLYQTSTKLLIQHLPFSRLVREILSFLSAKEYRWQSLAIEALQEATEIFITNLLEDAYLLTLHANRKTLKVKDLQLVRKIGYRFTPYI